jgi:hypothetical protein
MSTPLHDVAVSKSSRRLVLQTVLLFKKGPSNMPSPSLPSSLIKPIAALALLAAQPSIDAATYDWSGATSGNMSGTAANWGGTIPTGTDTASWNAATYTSAPTANANLTLANSYSASQASFSPVAACEADEPSLPSNTYTALSD